MSRYIDADALIKRWNNMSVRGRTEFDQEIMVAPSIDIVKCAECKEKGTEDCPMKSWNYTWGEYEFFNDVDDFCSYGKRRG